MATKPSPKKPSTGGKNLKVSPPHAGNSSTGGSTKKVAPKSPAKASMSKVVHKAATHGKPGKATGGNSQKVNISDSADYATKKQITSVIKPKSNKGMKSKKNC